MEIIITIIIISIWVVPHIVVNSIEAEKKRLKEKIAEIEKKYPFAYKEHNYFLPFRPKISDLKRITERPESEWIEENNKLMKVASEAAKIIRTYPNGYKKWKERYFYSDYKQILYHKDEIIKYDREEMFGIGLIDKKKQEREEEEKRGKKEKENRVISICQQYGITGLYHMTHIDNLASILSNGLLSHTQARNNNYLQTDIANNDVNVRRSHNEPIHNRPIHDYAPLYFNPKNPMLYFRKDIQNNIVILEFSPLVLLKEGVIFTDGNASVHTTATYNSQTQFYSDLNDLNKLDWKCINDKWWNDYEDGKRKKCAEVLIPDKIELSFLKRIHVFNSETQKVVSHLQIRNIDIEVTKSLFFE